MENKRIRVLVVDDSQNMRRLLSETLASSPQIEVVGTAADPYEARDLIVALRPDVLTLDIEMPKMDGITFLGKLMAKLPMPVIVVSTLCQRGSQAVVEALRLGAAEALVKPTGAREIPEFRQQLLLKVLGAAGARYRGALSAHSGGGAARSGGSGWGFGASEYADFCGGRFDGGDAGGGAVVVAASGGDPGDGGGAAYSAGVFA